MSHKLAASRKLLVINTLLFLMASLGVGLLGVSPWVTLALFCIGVVSGLSLVQEMLNFLVHKQNIAHVFGRQPFWGPFFNGEDQQQLAKDFQDALTLHRELQAQAAPFPEYAGQKLTLLLRERGSTEVIALLKDARERLDREKALLVERGTKAGIGVFEVKDLLSKKGTDWTRSHIEETERVARLLVRSIRKGKNEVVHRTLLESGPHEAEDLLDKLETA